MSKTYPWERRWLEISANKATDEPSYQLESTGYVAATEWLEFPKQAPIGLLLESIIDDRQVVVLLGEPGIGKSSEWKKVQKKLGGNKNHIFLNLGSFGSEDELRAELLGDATIEAWKVDDYTLTFWLDSLDEGLLHMRKLQDVLLRIIRKLPFDRLHLRITCRNAVWPAAFTESLNELWKFGPSPTKEQLSVLLLRPLTQQQVEDAAMVEGFEPEKFIEAVAEVDAQPLASIPVTLRLLLALYKKHQPNFGIEAGMGRAKLYRLGCLELCHAPDLDRDSKYKKDGRQRLLLAGYLAYLAIFSNRRQIYIEPRGEDLDENALDPYMAGAGVTAAWDGLRATISPTDIQDLLKNTSLFTDLGNGCMVWVHQAFAEFLAAWYINLTSISASNLRALFRSEVDLTGGIVPALRETAAWLAELQPLFWQELLHLDPLALVRSDMRRMDNDQRADVVQHLAKVIGTLAYPPYRESRDKRFMQQLHHPGLAVQLKPLLILDDVPPATVRFAADLAKECNVQELSPALTKLALDRSQSIRNRSYALNILRRIATEESKLILRNLIYHIPEEDEHNEFRADLLWILWPNHLTPDELLPLLIPDKDNYTGAYRLFLYRIEKEQLLFSSASVQAGLNWLNQNLSVLKHRHRENSFWRRFAELIWRRAWQLTDEAGVKETMAAAFVTVTAHHGYFSTNGSTNVARLEVAQTIILNYHKLVNWTNILISHQQDPLLTKADWDNLITIKNSKLSFSQREWLAKILLRFLVTSRHEETAAIYCQRYEQFQVAAKKYRSVRAVWREWFKPTSIRSKQARRDRKEWLREQKVKLEAIRRKRNRRRVALTKIGQQARFIRRLVERQVIYACRQWEHTLNRFQYDKTNNNHFRYLNDPGQSKRWQRLAPSLRVKILDRLWEFITQHPIPPPNWYEPGDYHSLGAGIIREGLVLIFSQREHIIRNQSPQFWQNLAPFLVRFDESAHDGIRYEFLQLVSSHAPYEVNSAIILGMDARDDRDHGTFSRYEDWHRFLPTAQFPALLLQGIELGVWNESLCSQIIISMLNVNYSPAWEYVRELLSVPPGENIDRPKLATAVFGSILFRKEERLLDVWQYWEWLSNHISVANTVINEKSISSSSDYSYLMSLSEIELETLTIWITYAFELSNNDIDDWDEKNPKRRYAGLRSAAIGELSSRGTATAWQILGQLNDQFGQPFWVRTRVDQVRENLRRNAWTPAHPHALIEMSLQAGKRWIRSAADLQEMVIESLGRLQSDLHNELAVANMLWIPKKVGNSQVGHSVRDENFLSDTLRIYLDKDLRRPEILIKREVEIRKSIGAGTGQRTDLYVDAFSHDETGAKTDVVTVVIEVKLAKNSEVETALEDQLIPYLVDQSYKHGIYLIGWHYGQYDDLPASKKDLPSLHKLLSAQTLSASTSYAIRTIILDMRLPADDKRVEEDKILFQVI